MNTLGKIIVCEFPGRQSHLPEELVFNVPGSLFFKPGLCEIVAFCWRMRKQVPSRIRMESSTITPEAIVGEARHFNLQWPVRMENGGLVRVSEPDLEYSK